MSPTLGYFLECLKFSNESKQFFFWQRKSQKVEATLTMVIIHQVPLKVGTYFPQNFLLPWHHMEFHTPVHTTNDKGQKELTLDY